MAVDQGGGGGGFFSDVNRRIRTATRKARTSASKPGAYSPDKYGAGGESSGPEPLGVSADYRVPYQRNLTGMSARAGEGWASQGAGHGSIGERGPQYWDGDEWAPASMDPASIGQLQAGLAAAGLLTSDWTYGVFGRSTMEAYKQLLEAANAAGLSDQAMLQQYANSPGQFGGSSSEGGSGGGHWEFDENGEPVWVPDTFTAPPLQVRLPDRTTVKEGLRAGIIDRLGQGYSDQELERMVDAYMTAVRQPQEAAYMQEVDRMEDEFYGREGASEAIETVDAPSLEAFMEETLREEDPDAYGAGQIGNDYAPAFFDALSGYV